MTSIAVQATSSVFIQVVVQGVCPEQFFFQQEVYLTSNVILTISTALHMILSFLPSRLCPALLLFQFCFLIIASLITVCLTLCFCTSSAPPIPTEVTAEVTNVSSVRVAWQWTSSVLAPYCFNETYVTYRPDGGGESSLQLSDPAATEATLTGLQCSTSYTISVHTSSGSTDTRSASRTVSLPARGTVQAYSYNSNVNCNIALFNSLHSLPSRVCNALRIIHYLLFL